MTNAEKYNFSDFTRDNYRKLLRLAKKKYTFETYHGFDKNASGIILWRHDVDQSVHSALKLAQIENEEGVVSTYFLLMHSEAYNLFEKEIKACVDKIISLGHQIGLHFDSHYYDLNPGDSLEKDLRFEKHILEQSFESEIRTFSFHNPNSFLLTCNEWQYGGMINTYAEYFQTKMSYCSDSNGYWRHERLENVLLDGQKERLQVLTHPESWQDEVMSPKQRAYRCADMRATRSKERYDRILSENGRLNVDW